MALSYETVETAPAAGAALGTQEQISAFIQAQIGEAVANAKIDLQVDAGEAVEKASKYGESLVRGMLADVRKQLESFAKPTERVMVVKVDEIKRKLSKAASPYLGEALIQAKVNMNTLLVGPRGCGKTTLAHQLGEALGMRSTYISFTQGASEAWITGRWTAKGEFIKSDFVDFYQNGGVFLLDEIDAADANLLMLINTALDSDTFKNPMTGEAVKRHKDFICIAAANTFGKGGNAQYTARTRLDAAFLGRFAGGTIVMDYCEAIEKQLCPDAKLYKRLLKARKYLLEKNSQEIVCSRMLRDAFTLKTQGLEEKRIMEKLTASWPKELAEQSGLLREEPKDDAVITESEPF